MSDEEKAPPPEEAAPPPEEPSPPSEEEPAPPPSAPPPEAPPVPSLLPEGEAAAPPPPPPPPAEPEPSGPSGEEVRIFVLKTTANQERAVANLLEKAAARGGHDIRSILIPEELKGYALVETPHREFLEQAMAGLHHARSLVRGETLVKDIAHFLVPKAMVTGITEGAIVEVVSGPFKGEKARIKRIDSAREEITVELFDALVPIPVTLRGDHVRVLTKEEAEGPG